MPKNGSVNIGLSGGMGCGKSTVLDWCRSHGLAVFETDACVRQLLAHDSGLQGEIREAFGDAVFGPAGGVDRGRLGSIVFGNPSSLAVLERLVHPRVRNAWQLEVANRHPCLVVEIPLLFEKNLQSAFDLTCCVVTDSRIQMHRLRSRGWSEAHIAQRLACQWSLAEKARQADVVLLNDGSKAHLGDQLEALMRGLGIGL